MVLREEVQGGKAPLLAQKSDMPDKSLPIIDLPYRLALEVNRAVGDFPPNQQPGLGRRIEEAAFDLLAAPVAARYRTGADKQAPLARAYAAGKVDAADIRRSLAGGLGYTRFADTYNFRRRLLAGSNCKGGVKRDAPGVIHVARRDKGDSMATTVTLTTICAPSDDIVAREIEGEVIIVPLTSGIGDADDELYTLNPTGQAIWQKLDGQRTLMDVAALLAGEFNAPLTDIESDVLGFASEMTRRGILAVSNQ